MSRLGFLAFICVFALGTLILLTGLTENNDYSLEGIEETVLTVRAIEAEAVPAPMTLEECFSLCDFAFERFSEINLACVAQCKE